MSESATSPNRSNLSRRAGFWGGFAAFFLVWLLLRNIDPENPLMPRMAAIAVLMAIWWISDAIPLAATALVPLVLYPLLGIMKGRDVAPIYVNYIIFLFVGGFLIALAMERWDLHKRIALTIIGWVGGNASSIVLGFMLATAFLSMWISNTATTIMMVAVGLAVIKSAESSFGKENASNLSTALFLGIAYSASVGGMATLIGTPPNLALVRIFEETFPGAAEAGFAFSFGQWMLFGVPLAAVLLFLIWILLTKLLFPPSPTLRLDRQAIASEKEKLGPIGFEETVVLIVFLLTAFLWMFRKSIGLGEVTIPGWSESLKTGSLIDDGTIAVAMALLLFLIPARNRKDESEGYGGILDFGAFSKIPWHIILLFGGGFALAKGFAASGLSAYVGKQFAGLEGTPVFVMVAALCTMLTFLTELTSNTATTEMILPILASIAVALKIHPLFLMIPAALSASCAFMMPVATPPNAIAFASGRIRISQMVKAGLVINVIGIASITIFFNWIGPAVFDFDGMGAPDWSAPPPPQDESL